MLLKFLKFRAAALSIHELGRLSLEYLRGSLQ